MQKSSQKIQDIEIFKVPAAFGYLMLFGGVFFISCEFFLGVNTNAHLESIWKLSPLWVTGFFGSIVFFRYRIIVKNESISFRTFIFRENVILFSEINDIYIRHTNNNPKMPIHELFVYVRGRRKISVSGLVKNIDKLAEKNRCSSC